MKKKENETTYTPSRKKAIYKYAESHERIYLTVPGDKKETYSRIASECGKSLSQFIVDAVDTFIDNME